MSPKEWFSQGSPTVVGAVLATAVVAGLGAGAGLKLPAYLAHPIHRTSPQMILADDPGLQKWSQVVASLGGIGATFVVPAAFYDDRTPPPEFVPDFEAQMAAATAEIDEQLRAADQRAQAVRLAWVETPSQGYRYEPVAYAATPVEARPVYGYGYALDAPREPDAPPESEQTSAAVHEPAPPPPPPPSDVW